MSEPLTHLRLVAINTHAWCGTKVDRYTRCEVSSTRRVTCLTCLAKALEWHAEASKQIAARQVALERERG